MTANGSVTVNLAMAQIRIDDPRDARLDEYPDHR